MSEKHTVLVSDKFDQQGIDHLRSQPNLKTLYEEGGMKRQRFMELIADAEALIVRSATKVDKEALERGKQLKVIVRAGVGVDNINIFEASRHGIIVQNAPGGNTISTAEQSLALLFGCARKTPQAHHLMKEGKWEKNRLKGIELAGKTLGVVGLGRIGKEVVKRARGLQMKVIGYDPFIPSQNLADLEIELVSKEEILSRSDFITVHTPLTESTRDFINSDNLQQLKRGVCLINAARGGIYNEEALVTGLQSGIIGAAALDVFVHEPLPADSALRTLENCILTPHLGASTGDAELAVAKESVDSVIAYFQHGVARNALNFPTVDPEVMDFLRPYFEGGISVGKLLAQISKKIQNVEISYHGEIANYMFAPVTAAIQYGLLSPAMGEEVNIVNAPVFAKERGIKISENKTGKARDFSSFVQVKVASPEGSSVELLYSSLRRQPMVVSMYGLPIEFKPENIILSIKNRDIPGVVGTIGNFLGKLGVNIAHLELSRDNKGGTGYCIITTDDLISTKALDKLRSLENILDAQQIDLR